MSTTPMDTTRDLAALIADAVARTDTGELGEVWEEVDRRRAANPRAGSPRRRDRKATPDPMTRRH